MPPDLRLASSAPVDEGGFVRPVTVGGGTLVRDYLAGLPAAARFFAGAPFDLDSYRRKLEEVTARFGPDRREAAARCLRPTSPAAAERLRRFIDEGGAVVTTGQQAGFLTGPLYTIYKALSAVSLARHLEDELGVLVLPVFWVASEDHDWAEVNHAIVLDAQNRARRFTLPSEDERPLPMSERRLEGDLPRLLDEIAQAVGGKGGTSDWVKRILDPYRRPGATVASAFGEAMAAVLAPFDACIADAADPALKAASAGVLRTALVDAQAHEARLSERSDELSEAGYRPQVAVLEGGTNVFYATEGGRERLYRRAGEYVVRGRKERLDGERLLAEVEASPERFSPNVFLRPVVESHVFPTLAYVGGPGELAYFAQVDVLFRSYEILPPVAIPRFSGLVVEPKVERLLERLDLRVEEAFLPREELIERLARREVPGELSSALNELRAEVARVYERLVEEATELDPTLAGAVGGSRNRALLESARLERKVLRAVKRGDRIALQQLDRVLDSLHPHGAPQDRVLNVLPFLARYGDHFVREVERAITTGWRLPR